MTEASQMTTSIGVIMYRLERVSADRKRAAEELCDAEIKLQSIYTSIVRGLIKAGHLQSFDVHGFKFRSGDKLFEVEGTSPEDIVVRQIEPAPNLSTIEIEEDA